MGSHIVERVRHKRKSSRNWIQKAIKHPGALRAAAKRAGMSTHQYAEAHKHDPGKTGQRARLALRLEKMHKK